MPVRGFATWLLPAYRAAACGVIIASGVDALGLGPYTVLSKIITLNNVIGGMTGVLLLIAVYDITRGQLGLLWVDVMDADPAARRMTGPLGAWIATAGAAAGLAGGILPGLPANLLGWISTGAIILGALLL